MLFFCNCLTEFEILPREWRNLQFFAMSGKQNLQLKDHICKFFFPATYWQNSQYFSKLIEEIPGYFLQQIGENRIFFLSWAIESICDFFLDLIDEIRILFFFMTKINEIHNYFHDQSMKFTIIFHEWFAKFIIFPGTNCQNSWSFFNDQRACLWEM